MNTRNIQGTALKGLGSASSDPDVIDIVFVGAGPHTLASVARIFDPLPPRDHLSDSSHSELISNNLMSEDRPSIKVFDDTGKWLARWKGYFKSLRIPHLRSLVTHHPDPSDTNALLEFAFKNGRREEIVGLESLFAASSKVKDQRWNLANLSIQAVPSARLFTDFCDAMVERLGLQELIIPHHVTSIVPLRDRGTKNKPWFKVTYDNGKSIVCKRVVVGVGTANMPRIPHWASAYGQYIRHAFQQPEEKQAPFKTTAKKPRILIIGGGLTACHLAINEASKGQVHLCVRGAKLRVVQFDVTANWIGRFSNVMFSSFFQASPIERYRLVQLARGRGSVSPEVYKRIQELERSSDDLTISYNCEVLKVSPVDPSRMRSGWSVTLQKNGQVSTAEYDTIQLATGAQLDITKEPFLQEVARMYPTDTIDGYPVLYNDEDLSWHSQCRSLHILGGYAALSLGPMAHNLAGAVRASRLLYHAAACRADDNTEDPVCDLHNSFAALADEDTENESEEE